MCLLGLVACGPALATTLLVTSVAEASAQVIINGSVVRTLGIGEVSPEGVALRSIRNGVAEFEVDNAVRRFGIGQSTTSQAVMRAGSDGHFRANALVNGMPVRALIDTGATNVILGGAAAARLGIDYRRGRREIAQTANGSVITYLVTLSRMQVGDILLANVPCNVLEGAQIAKDLDMLVGNSFLGQVHMEKKGGLLTLTRSNGL